MEKMKKTRFIFFATVFLFSVIFALFILRAVDLKTVNSNITGNLESGKKTIDNVKELKNKEKWDYLIKEWKKIFLSNPIISKLDQFFTKISIVFKIFIGIDYSFSFLFFFSLFLWFYLLYNINFMLKSLKLFKGFIGFAIALLVVMLLGQFNFYASAYASAINLTKYLYSFLNFIPWIIFIIICFFAVLIILFESETFFAFIRNYFDKEYKELQAKMVERDRALFHMIVNKLSNIFTKNR